MEINDNLKETIVIRLWGSWGGRGTRRKQSISVLIKNTTTQIIIKFTEKKLVGKSIINQ